MKMHKSPAARTASGPAQALQLPFDFSLPVPAARRGSMSAHYCSRTEISARVHCSPHITDASPVAVPYVRPTTQQSLRVVSADHTPPRFICFRDAPRFFGMDKNRFNREIRPTLAEIRIGRQGLAFDRLEMEAAAEEYRCRNGCLAAHRSKPWDTLEDERPGSSSVLKSGTLIKLSTERAFEKALAQAT